MHGFSKIINPIADEFDHDWNQGGTPKVEVHLEKVSEEVRPHLLAVLLPIDIEYRKSRGDTPVAEDYARFGAQAVQLAEELLSGSSEPSIRDQRTRMDPEPLESRSRTIGPYKLLQQIGEGGMGTVWMAEQAKPVRRRVALKVIKRGMDSKQILARFEAERQALSMMNHPNIARVLDCGTTDEGLPYFAMELVKGISITKYCDQNQLDIAQRLSLFGEVCDAVHHAHQKGIIHRDLKPSNILIALYDGKPVAKVIDFGLAKALDNQNRLTDRTMFTEFGQIVGTFQYMSPEQAEMNELDVDTRTDIYSLGVILYELLTGTTPLEKSSIQQKTHLKVLEMIRDLEPPRPSTRLSQSNADAVAGLSKQRKSEPARLQKLLRGDLDWIVMKALEKDRSRRYETAREFNADLNAHLWGAPVSARPPSSTYLLLKAYQRNKGVFWGTGAVACALIFGIAFSTWFAIKAERNRKIATEQRNNAIAEKRKADEANKEAQKQKLEAERLMDVAEQSKSSLQEQKEQLERYNASLKYERWSEVYRQVKVARDEGDFVLAKTMLEKAHSGLEVAPFSPSVDTSVLFSSLRSPLTLIDFKAFGSWETIHHSISPDQKTLVASDGSGQIHVFDLEKDRLVGSWGNHRWRVEKNRACHVYERVEDSNVILKRDERFPSNSIEVFLKTKWQSSQELIAVAQSGKVMRFDLMDQTVEVVETLEGPLGTCEFVKDRLWAADRLGKLTVLSLEDQSKRTLDLSAPATMIGALSEPDRCMVGLQNKKISLIDAVEMKVIDQIELPFVSKCHAIRPAADGDERILVGGNAAKLFEVRVDFGTASHRFAGKTAFTLDIIQNVSAIKAGASRTIVFDGFGRAEILDSALRLTLIEGLNLPNVRIPGVYNEPNTPNATRFAECVSWQSIDSKDDDSGTVFTVSGQGGMVQFWRESKKATSPFRQFETAIAEPVSLAFDRGSRSFVFMLSKTGQLHLINIETNHVLDSIDCHQARGNWMREATFGVATSGDDGAIRFWKNQDGKIVIADEYPGIKIEKPILGFDLFEEKKIGAFVTGGSELVLFNLEAGTIVEKTNISGDDSKRPASGAVAFDQDGKTVFAFGSGQTSGFFSVPQLRRYPPRVQLGFEGGLDGIWIAGRGNPSVLTCDGGRVWRYELVGEGKFAKQEGITSQANLAEPVVQFSRTKDGKRVLGFRPDGSILSIGNSLGLRVCELSTPANRVQAGAVNSDCDRILLVDHAGKITVVNGITGRTDRNEPVKVQKWSEKVFVLPQNAKLKRLDLNYPSIQLDDLDFVCGIAEERKDFKLTGLGVVESKRNNRIQPRGSGYWFFQENDLGIHSELIDTIAPLPGSPMFSQGVSVHASENGFAGTIRRQHTNKTEFDGEVWLVQKHPSKDWLSKICLTNKEEDKVLVNAGWKAQIIAAESGYPSEFIHFSHNGYHLLHSKLENGVWTHSKLGKQGDGKNGLWLFENLSASIGNRSRLVCASNLRHQKDRAKFVSFEWDGNRVSNRHEVPIFARNPLAVQNHLHYPRQDSKGDVFFVNLVPGETPKLKLLKYTKDGWQPCREVDDYGADTLLDYQIEGSKNDLCLLVRDTQGRKVSLMKSSEGQDWEKVQVYKFKEGVSVPQGHLLRSKTGQLVVTLVGESEDQTWIKVLRRE